MPDDCPLVGGWMRQSNIFLHCMKPKEDQDHHKQGRQLYTSRLKMPVVLDYTCRYMHTSLILCGIYKGWNSVRWRNINFVKFSQTWTLVFVTHVDESETTVFEMNWESAKWSPITRKLVNQSHSRLFIHPYPILHPHYPILHSPFWQGTSWAYRRLPIRSWGSWRGQSLYSIVDTTALLCTSVSLLSRRKLKVREMAV